MTDRSRGWRVCMLLPALMVWMLWVPRADAQFGFPISGVFPGGPSQFQPPDSITSTTNRIDVNRDGGNDFEIVETRTSRFVFGQLGWLSVNSIDVTLVPQGDSRVLVSETSLGVFDGFVPILARGDAIGSAPAGRRWASESQSLMTRNEPSALAGPLAAVWNGAVGRFYVAVRMGEESAPVYGWLCFTRDRGATFPLNWGYARAVSVPVVAGDPETAPALRLKLTRIRGLSSLQLSWEPNLGGVLFEHNTLEARSPWQTLETSGGSFFESRVTVDALAPEAEFRRLRVRVAP